MIDTFFEKVLNLHLKERLINSQNVGGGCINNTVRLLTTSGSFFIKWNTANEADLFHKEALGLQLLTEHSSISIPNVLGRGTIDDKSYLLLEWVESGHSSENFWKVFGNKLAQMHMETSSRFGLDHDNHIGRLPQNNRQYENWSDFFIHTRLEPQLKMATRNNLIDSGTLAKFEILFPKLEHLIPIEQPSFIHGDLWSGNFLTNQDGFPVLIDPAVHYGHRETELSFTRMFGGFSSSFYKSYQEEFPLEPGFEDRIEIHNLYPLLVHLNLFGSSYLSGIKQTLKRFT